MKIRKLNFLKIGILFFGITILLWNCEKEEIEKEVVKKSNYSVSKINFSDIKQNTQLIQKLEKFSKRKKLMIQIHKIKTCIRLNTILQ